MAEESSLLGRINKFKKYVVITYNPKQNMIYSKQTDNFYDPICTTPNILTYVFEAKDPKECTNIMNDKEPITRATSTNSRWNFVQQHIQYFALSKQELNEIKNIETIQFRDNYVAVINRNKREKKFECHVFENGDEIYQISSKIKSAQGFIFVFYHRKCINYMTRKEKSKIQFVTGFEFNFH